MTDGIVECFYFLFSGGCFFWGVLQDFTFDDDAVSRCVGMWIEGALNVLEWV